MSEIFNNPTWKKIGRIMDVMEQAKQQQRLRV